MPVTSSRDPRGLILFYMAVLHMMCHGLLTLLTPLYLALQADFGLDRVEPITALSTWSAVTFALATLAAGLVVDRLPTKLVAGLGLVVHGLGLVMMALSPTLTAARWWIVVASIGAAGYHPVSARVIVGLFPESVGRAMGLAALGAGLGFYLGPQYSGWMTALAGWRVAIAGAGGAGIAVALAYLLTTPEPDLRGAEPRRAAGENHRRNQLLFLVALGLLGLLLIPRDFAGNAFETLNSLFLQRSLGLDVALVGALLGAKGLVSLVTNVLLTSLSDRGERLWWWAGVLLVSAALAALVPWLPPVGAKLALVLSGTFLLANYPIFECALVERVPARLRGRTYSVILAIVGTFSAFAPKYIGGRVDALVGGAGAAPAALFRTLYGGVGLVLLTTLAALPMLALLRRRSVQLGL